MANGSPSGATRFRAEALALRPRSGVVPRHGSHPAAATAQKLPASDTRHPPARKTRTAHESTSTPRTSSALTAAVLGTPHVKRYRYSVRPIQFYTVMLRVYERTQACMNATTMRRRAIDLKNLLTSQAQTPHLPEATLCFRRPNRHGWTMTSPPHRARPAGYKVCGRSMSLHIAHPRLPRRRCCLSGHR